MTVVANCRYDDPTIGALPVGEVADGVVGTLRRCGGTERQRHMDVTTAESRQLLDEWASTSATAGRILYWGGHGASDGERHWLFTRETTYPPTPSRALLTRELESFLRRDWQRRSLDVKSWTVIVLDCCGAGLGVRNLAHVLSGSLDEPSRLALVGACGHGASFSARFAEELELAVERRMESDEDIPVVQLLFDVATALHGDVRPMNLLNDVRIANPRAAGGVLTMGLDALAEFRRALESLPDERRREVRSHFVAKAQGAELGDGGWYFEGRARRPGGWSSG